MFLNWRFAIVCALFIAVLFHSARVNTEVLVGMIVGIPAGVAAFYVLEVLIDALFLLINELEELWIIKATLG